MPEIFEMIFIKALTSIMVTANKNRRRIRLTKEKLALLQNQLERTQAKIPSLLTDHQLLSASGLTYRIVYNWLIKRIKTADENQYNSLLHILERLPDWDVTYVAITKQTLQTLENHKFRTGINPQKLLQNKSDLPDGLNYHHINNILWGHLKKTKRIYFEYVLYEWEKLPDKISRVAITDEILAELRAQKLRTGVGPMALLYNSQRERPCGLTSKIIGGWFEGRTKSAQKDHLDYVLEKYNRLPDTITP